MARKRSSNELRDVRDPIGTDVLEEAQVFIRPDTTSQFTISSRTALT